MQAKLAALSGPLSNSDFLIAGSLSIGRDSSNSVCLEDVGVSASHCSITSDHDRFLLTDLNSANGTFVNGIPVLRRALQAGDEIAVGSSLFLFQLEDSRAPVPHAVEMDENSVAARQTQRLRPDELVYLNPESLAALPQSSRLARALSTLLKISASIGSIRDVESLQWQLLGMIFDVIPGERGAILLLDGRAEEVSCPVAWDRAAGPDHPVPVSRALVRKVIEERISILENEDLQLDSPQNFEPSERKPARSILCVPLAVARQVLGVIYLDSRNPAATFTTDDLQLLTAIAGLAAIAIENARQFKRLGIENHVLRAEVSLQHDMVGQSPRMREVYKFIERVAPSDSTVLIYGESGTGKELVACAIHKNSPRRDQPLVALNCAAFTETLLESEFFGHEKGAFTSAISLKKGLLEVAEGGTVFLDEVGDLPIALQAKLLRVLQEREFVRVGGNRPMKLNVRFLAATNRDLQQAVREEKFRADLFHRLNVISLNLPALREHPEDIPVLAEHFAARYMQKRNRSIKGISPDARACLMQYDWPGNIRELQNAIERAVVIGSSEFILPEDLPEALLDLAPSFSPAPKKYHEAIRVLKKQMILNALEQSGGSFTAAAEFLGLHVNYLHRLIRNLDLRVTRKKLDKA